MWHGCGSGTMDSMTGGRDRLAELLEGAGLETVGDWRVEEVALPGAAWRLLSAGEVKPTVVVRVLDPARAQFYATRGLRIVCPTSSAIETLVGAVRSAEEEAVAS